MSIKVALKPTNVNKSVFSLLCMSMLYQHRDQTHIRSPLLICDFIYKRWHIFYDLFVQANQDIAYFYRLRSSLPYYS